MKRTDDKIILLWCGEIVKNIKNKKITKYSLRNKKNEDISLKEENYKDAPYVVKSSCVDNENIYCPNNMCLINYIYKKCRLLQKCLFYKIYISQLKNKKLKQLKEYIYLAKDKKNLHTRKLIYIKRRTI
ncbi:hypothetical protein C923_05452 [Plasmodium falciparum UGT5.1]|uniref:Uncharacterized protein n=1 Tax=Plasmodium falciparum UGT5.1 TaxID=1237627 RepID=W7J4J5_PLAFA|nr:hypothetical protein C923_05452 [Plasmodium falciparum UGT5.1]